MHSGDESLLLEAWRMMAYTLMADEQYQEAVPFYEQSIQHFEQIGDSSQAARSRIGYVLALTHSDAIRKRSKREFSPRGGFRKTATRAASPESVRILGMSIAGWMITSRPTNIICWPRTSSRNSGTSRRWLNCM